MISAQLQPVLGLPASERGFRNTKPFMGSCRAPQQPTFAPVHLPVCCDSSSGSSASRRSAGVCRAEPEPVSGYTPADYISFSQDDNRQCHHNAEVWVNAPLDTCYSLWSNWTSLLDFLDLVAQIGLDNGNPHMALFQCFYRYRKLPLMEIVFLLDREEKEDTLCKSIHFKSVYGMPIKGQVQLSEQLDGRTRVRLYFTHPVPDLLVQLQIGPFGVETDLQQILAENMEAYRQQVEALAPPDFLDQKEAIGQRVQGKLDFIKQEWEKEQQQKQQAGQQETPGQQQEQQQQSPQEQHMSAPVAPKQQQQQQQPASSDAAAAPKRARGRSTASKASAAADAAGVAGPPPPAQAETAASAAAAAAAGQPVRGRKTTTVRGRSVSKTAAVSAAADEGSNGSGSSAADSKRRSRMSSSAAADAAAPSETGSSNGTGAAPSSGRRTTTRRTSKRASTAAKE